MGIFEKFKIGFKKSASTFTSGLREIIIKKEIDDKTLNEIEDFLIQSDVGVSASEQIKNIIAQKKVDPKKSIVDEIKQALNESGLNPSNLEIELTERMMIDDKKLSLKILNQI